MLLTHFSQCCKTYDFNVHAWNCHSVMHLCIFMHLPIFHTLGRSSWMHTSKETPPTYTIPHYFWSTFEFKGILHGYGWKESYMRFFTGTMSLQNEFFGHHGSGLGKGFHFKKLGLERHKQVWRHKQVFVEPHLIEAATNQQPSRYRIWPNIQQVRWGFGSFWSDLVGIHLATACIELGSFHLVCWTQAVDKESGK